jgi:alpha-D-ribose 1-methylphosphonate 5-triphosphate synthase subunit PhnH
MQIVTFQVINTPRKLEVFPQLEAGAEESPEEGVSLAICYL